MRSQDILRFRQLLRKRRDALRASLAWDLSLLQQPADGDGDGADLAIDSEQDELNARLAEIESRELAEIEKALELMERGRYGVCEGCRKDIPTTRLQAVPHATLCIRCQREAEKVLPFGGPPARWENVANGEEEYTFNQIGVDVS